MRLLLTLKSKRGRPLYFEKHLLLYPPRPSTAETRCSSWFLRRWSAVCLCCACPLCWSLLRKFRWRCLQQVQMFCTVTNIHVPTMTQHLLKISKTTDRRWETVVTADLQPENRMVEEDTADVNTTGKPQNTPREQNRYRLHWCLSFLQELEE